jgi:hypothetical protein
MKMAARMTKQHFELIAAAISDAWDYLEHKAIWLEDSERRVARQVVWTVAEFLADKLAKTNPLFSRCRFYRACGLN